LARKEEEGPLALRSTLRLNIKKERGLGIAYVSGELMAEEIHPERRETRGFFEESSPGNKCGAGFDHIEACKCLIEGTLRGLDFVNRA